MYVLAFDRDWTVDISPHPKLEMVPIDWIRYWAHETPHEVWAIGNQDLVEEADIPGTVESIRRRDGDIAALGELNEHGHYEWWPSREDRLKILANLFPDAEEYIVVDDLDLSDVDGWRHYYAWDFVEGVRSGEIKLSPPTELVKSDGGLTDERIKSILDEGEVFELTYHEGGSSKNYLVTHIEPRRPSQRPINPRGYRFQAVGTTNQFTVRQPNIKALVPLEVADLSDTLIAAKAAGLREQLTEEPQSVPDAEIVEVLQAGQKGEVETERRATLRLAQTVLKARPDMRIDLLEPLFRLLQQDEFEAGKKALKTLSDICGESPSICEDYVTEMASLVNDSPYYEEHAARCLMETAEASPGKLIEVVPVLETALTDGAEKTRSYVVYTISTIAEEYPSQVYPATSALAEALSSDNETMRTNALAALGKIASDYPEGAESVIEDVSGLLDSEEKKTRNNAVGLLADLAQAHPELVVEYTEAIADRLSDENIQARINASLALIEAGEADPSAIRDVSSEIVDALDDASPAVRANACTLIGNAGINVDIEKLRSLSRNDPNERVREQATWAVSRLT